MCIIEYESHSVDAHRSYSMDSELPLHPHAPSSDQEIEQLFQEVAVSVHNAGEIGIISNRLMMRGTFIIIIMDAGSPGFKLGRWRYE